MPMAMHLQAGHPRAIDPAFGDHALGQQPQPDPNRAN